MDKKFSADTIELLHFSIQKGEHVAGSMKLFDRFQATLGETLWTFRVHRRFTKKEVADALSRRFVQSVSAEFVEQYEKGEIILNRQQFVAICSILGCGMMSVFKWACWAEDKKKLPEKQQALELLKALEWHVYERLQTAKKPDRRLTSLLQEIEEDIADAEG